LLKYKPTKCNFSTIDVIDGYIELEIPTKFKSSEDKDISKDKDIENTKNNWKKNLVDNINSLKDECDKYDNEMFNKIISLINSRRVD
jgi:hypothetical protein